MKNIDKLILTCLLSLLGISAIAGILNLLNLFSDKLFDELMVIVAYTVLVIVLFAVISICKDGLREREIV